MTALAWILLGLFWLLLAVAAISDLRSLRISNMISLATLAAAVALLLFVRSDAGPWWQHLASFTIMLAIGFGLFSVGWIGGGDAKFAAAAAALFDLSELAYYVLATTLAGALVTIVLMLLRRLSLGGNSSWKGLARGRSIPYGVAIAIGAAIVSAQVIASPL